MQELLARGMISPEGVPFIAKGLASSGVLKDLLSLSITALTKKQRCDILPVISRSMMAFQTSAVCGSRIEDPHQTLPTWPCVEKLNGELNTRATLAHNCLWQVDEHTRWSSWLM